MQKFSALFIVFFFEIFAVSPHAFAATGCKDPQIEAFFDRASAATTNAKKRSYQEIGIDGTCSIQGRFKKLSKGYEFKFVVGVLNEPRVIYFADKANFVKLFRDQQGPAATTPTARADMRDSDGLTREELIKFANAPQLTPEEAYAQIEQRKADIRQLEGSSLLAHRSKVTPAKELFPVDEPEPITAAQVWSTPMGWGGKWSRSSSSGKKTGGTR